MFQGWDHATTLLLLTVYEENATLFTNHNVKKKQAWEIVATKMTEVDSSIKITGADCSKKLSNMEQRYREKVDKKGQTGRGSGKEWRYFERMQDLFGVKASAVSVSQSACGQKKQQQISPPSDTSGEEELDQEAQKSVGKTSHPQKRQRRAAPGGDPPQWFAKFMEQQKADEEKWRSELRDSMKRQEDIMRDRVSVLREIKDVIKSLVEGRRSED